MIKRPSKLERGFTLIEIMVVVAIIGTIVALISVKLSRDIDRLARLEAERFHAIVNEVRDEAIIVGEPFILAVDKHLQTYGFTRPYGRGNSLNDDGLLKPHSLESGVTFDWDVFSQLEQKEGKAPSVLITPLGEITVFDIAFFGDEFSYHVFVNEKNQLYQRIETSGFR